MLSESVACTKGNAAQIIPVRMVHIYIYLPMFMFLLESVIMHQENGTFPD